MTDDFPLPRYPFGWPELKAKIETTYAFAFSVNYVRRDPTNLKRGHDTFSFHARFTDLAGLVGKSPEAALYGPRLWDIYYEKISA